MTEKRQSLFRSMRAPKGMAPEQLVKGLYVILMRREVRTSRESKWWETNEKQIGETSKGYGKF